ncbi:MAG: alpha-L-fucosidase [Oscillospiraceae bacterium]|jgi:alpha-L-fucosidase|nr:alpha-L-fucosidase [Oscillospiraceae bacterium]
MFKDIRVALVVLVVVIVVGVIAAYIVSTRLVNKEGIAEQAWFLKKTPASAAKKIKILPSERQLLHARNEVCAFFHYGMNTFTDSEIGTGKEAPKLFNATELDTDQWIKAVADTGFTGAIITAKHHDGFCLWPSEYTDFSVKNGTTPVDVVKAFSKSCKKYNIKFGVYLSPFDEHEPTFGQGDAYNDFYVNQLTELLTNYGDIFEVWFDGYITDECKGKQTYDWERWVAIVRELQPNANTAVAPPEPDVAWVGNETGLAEGNVNSVRLKSNKYIWAKSECDVSIRKGWFYHKSQKPKNLDKLMNIYYNSVGKNCTLLLNIPPMPSGKLNAGDMVRLAEFGDAIHQVTAKPLAAAVQVQGKDTTAHAVDSLNVNDAAAYSFADDEYIVDIKLSGKAKLRTLWLSEDIKNTGERIEKFSAYAQIGDKYFKIGESKSVGGKTLVRLSSFVPKSDTIRIVIEKSKAAPVLRYIGVFA